MARPKKQLTTQEIEFGKLIVERGIGPIEAARKVFRWKCEPGSSEQQKALDLARTPRVKKFMESYRQRLEKEAGVEEVLDSVPKIQLDNLREFAYEKLVAIRDDPRTDAQSRFSAISAIEKLADPAKDVNLVLAWLSILWRVGQAHCPCCHRDFPLAKIKEKQLEKFVEDLGDPIEVEENPLQRRIDILKRGNPRATPHPGQIPALEAQERHLVITAPARTGKSVVLAMFGWLGMLIPGAEVWILSKTYDAARKEIGYLKEYINTTFYPFSDHLIKEYHDRKNNEYTLFTKWGSELRVRSVTSKGSITGSELDIAIVAEPGWVSEDIYEELRARMSSRLGRIIMAGTPKGYGGILSRLINVTGRDPKTGRMRRIPPEKRTLKAGAPWGSSLLRYTMDPKDNPTYVKSELEAARMELTDEEYASEFEGLMGSGENALFPQIKPQHLVPLRRSDYEKCAWVLGVDQGQKNFAYTVVGWDGDRILVTYPGFFKDELTIKSHMNTIRYETPGIIKKIGGIPDQWDLTIFDLDPSVHSELNEFEMEGKPWPTEITYRHKNQRGKHIQENWRKEVYQFINRMAAQDKILFDIEYCSILHSQLMEAQIRADTSLSEDGKMSHKGWVISDKFLGDHGPDSLVLAVYTIFIGMIQPPEGPPHIGDAWDEQQKAFEYRLAVSERAELTGGALSQHERSRIFSETFGRERERGDVFLPSNPSPYKDY